MDAGLVRAVRRFNRVVTQRVGALNDAYLARSRPLGFARVLWELEPGGTDVRALRSRLGLDSGYLSRLLRSLEADGLVVVSSHAGDARVRTVRPTEAGSAERAVLDRASDELATSILDPLTDRQRQRLAAAMGEVERLLLASMVVVEPHDPQHPHARACLRAYFAELAARFDAGFDPGASNSATDDELRPPAGILLVATLQGEPVGCGALKLHGNSQLPRPATSPDSPADIKRMWVSPGVRGLGLGRRILLDLEARAVAAGARAVRLETNRALVEAIAMYRAAGYREVPAFNDEPYGHHWFEKALPKRR
jgi:DNA-binding MarR family transcriptional regulator/GNAT superfamily N-acetyltransferase